MDDPDTPSPNQWPDRPWTPPAERKWLRVRWRRLQQGQLWLPFGLALAELVLLLVLAMLRTPG
jgi:hypothetical protein